MPESQVFTVKASDKRAGLTIAQLATFVERVQAMAGPGRTDVSASGGTITIRTPVTITGAVTMFGAVLYQLTAKVGE